MDYKNTLNERDKVVPVNLIDYRGVLVIPTLHMVEVPKTNIIENLAKNRRMVDSTFFTDTTSVPRPEKIKLDEKILKKAWSKEKSIFRNYILETPNMIK